MSTNALRMTLAAMACSWMALCAISAGAEEKAAAAATLENLQAAYTGESIASHRYLAFANQADSEGCGPVASLFRATARAAQVNARRHAAILTELGWPVTLLEMAAPVVADTKENLEAALKEQARDSAERYPSFLLQAKRDAIGPAIAAFDLARKAAEARAKLYRKTLSRPAARQGKAKNFFVCSNCGAVVERLPASRCPICRASSRDFIPIR